ncbi:MAG TPA: phenylalanine--tRNA ligase subunit beta [Sphingomicrobium sp.]|jgi:phenylalanyl-tRNA synthetase beta chain|nr:phenylalanine--tRNA ligase subunit beta [Sphingomicrobium sp.]
MKFTLSWLRDHLETDASGEAIAEKLTNIGLEVESLSNPADALTPFKVARVLTAERHPQADKLQVLTVDAGTGEAIQVVCGATNARAGMIGIFGPPGAYIPGSELTLKVAAIRGIESRGMMCSARELELGEDHSGIVELPEDAPIGSPFAQYAGLDDPVFDVNVTPNRQDAMGVRGIARDLAAAGAGRLKPLAVPQIEGGFPCPVSVRIDDLDGCPAFFGRAIRGLANGVSPGWMQRRLKAAGQRPISALVDITNYVMIDLGRPSHAYDIAKLSGGLTARAARAGERVLALNEKEYTLEPFMTVIADDAQVHDIGGIMGGEDSGVSGTTSDVMLEIAYFTPERIARTGQALGLTSDARTRFERGVDPGFLDDGLAILSGLILDICGGEPSAAVHVGEPPVEPRLLTFDFALTRSLGGIDVPEQDQKEILESLGFTVDGNTVAIPTWRRDVEGPADLVEEIARIYGYDRVPSTPLERQPGVAKPTATRSQLIEKRARRTAAARGFDEAVTWSFISKREADAFGGGDWMLANPISEEMGVMRPSLLPGLISAARRNLDRGAPVVRLFEIGRRYLLDAERATLSFILAGERRPRGWQSGRAQAFDPFDAKTETLALLEAAGAPVDNLQVFPDAGPTWHPGRSATLRLGPKAIVAAFGELHPGLQKSLDAPVGAVAAEIYLDAIPTGRSSAHARAAYAPPPLQALTRDFAFIVASDLAADKLLGAVRGADKNAITHVRLFDRFETPEGLSLAFEVTLQPIEKSFTDDEIADISKRVVEAAEKLGARLRS